MYLRLLFPLLFVTAAAGLFACPGDTGDTGETPTAACPDRAIGQVIDRDTIFNAGYDDLIDEDGAAPDFSCCVEANGILCPALDATQVDPAAIADYVMNGVVNDFADDVPQDGAFVRLWESSGPGELVNPTTTPAFDSQAKGDNATDATGLVTIDGAGGEGIVPSCTPIGYETWTEYLPERTKHTFETGVVLPPPANGTNWNAGSGDDVEILSVSTLTYALVPLAAGNNPRAGTGLAAGSIEDCNGRALEGIQLVVVPEDFVYGDSLLDALVEVMQVEGTCNEVYIRYFRNELPDRTALWTSDDGIFGAIDVPAGVWRMLALGKTGGRTCPDINPDHPDLCPIAERTLHVLPDSVNIANAHARQYPDACLVAP